jgi:hypothetical protein
MSWFSPHNPVAALEGLGFAFRTLEPATPMAAAPVRSAPQHPAPAPARSVPAPQPEPDVFSAASIAAVYERRRQDVLDAKSAIFGAAHQAPAGGSR